MTGGFDKRILAAGKKEIERELERIRPVVEEGGYIPTIDHGTPPDVYFANVCHYVQCSKKMLRHIIRKMFHENLHSNRY